MRLQSQAHLDIFLVWPLINILKHYLLLVVCMFIETYIYAKKLKH